MSDIFTFFSVKTVGTLKFRSCSKSLKMGSTENARPDNNGANRPTLKFGVFTSMGIIRIVLKLRRKRKCWPTSKHGKNCLAVICCWDFFLNISVILLSCHVHLILWLCACVYVVMKNVKSIKIIIKVIHIENTHANHKRNKNTIQSVLRERILRQRGCSVAV